MPFRAFDDSDFDRNCLIYKVSDSLNALSGIGGFGPSIMARAELDLTIRLNALSGIGGFGLSLYGERHSAPQLSLNALSGIGGFGHDTSEPL